MLHPANDPRVRAAVYRARAMLPSAVPIRWTDLEAMATALGVGEVIIKPAACDGLLLGSGGKWKIIISDSVLNVRRRFTLAHELGHLLLRLAVPQDLAVQGGQCWHNWEQAANWIASEILMPEEVVAQSAAVLAALGKREERCDLFWRAIAAEARRFEVSWAAMLYRTIVARPGVLIRANAARSNIQVSVSPHWMMMSRPKWLSRCDDDCGGQSRSIQIVRRMTELGQVRDTGKRTGNRAREAQASQELPVRCHWRMGCSDGRDWLFGLV